jgi:hypothetical protein
MTIVQIYEGVFVVFLFLCFSEQITLYYSWIKASLRDLHILKNVPNKAFSSVSFVLVRNLSFSTTLGVL